MSTKKEKTTKKALRFVAPEGSFVKFSEGSEGEKQKAEMLAYSGKIIKNHWWWGDLAIDISGVGFQGNTIPILEDHSISKKIGFSKKPDLSDNKIFFKDIQLLSNQYAQEFSQNSKDGFPYQASVYVQPTKIQRLEENEEAEVNGFKMKGPGTIFRQTILKEASVTVFGYDNRTNSKAFSDDNEEVDLEMQVEEHTHEEVTEVKFDVTKFKQEDPEGYQKFVSDIKKDVEVEAEQKFSEALKSKDKEIEKLTAENTKLSEENKQTLDAVKELEKKEAMRTEREIRASANSIVSAKLSASKLSERVQKKVASYISVDKFIKDGQLDEAALSAKVEEEVKDWEKDLAVPESPIQGQTSFSKGFGPEEKEENAFSEEAMLARMLGHVGQKTENSQ